MGTRNLPPCRCDVLFEPNQRQYYSLRADFFRLTVEDLETLDRYAKKSAENLIVNIENSRKAPLDRVINALGIRHVGEHTARQLAIRFGALEALSAASEDDLTSVRDIGAEVAHSIREYFDEIRSGPLLTRTVPQ